MGVIMTNCCKNEYTPTELMTSSSIRENVFNDESSLLKVPEIKNSDQGIDYIISNECYQILIKKVPKNIFVKKLCQNLNAQEIFYFIKKAINWILPIRIEKNDKKIKHYIIMVKNYTKFGTKKILDELESLNINHLMKKNDENILLQSLSDWMMLIELIMYLNNSSHNNNRGSDFSCKNICTVYDITLWNNRNLEEIIKKYSFDGCYYLLQIKIKYNQANYQNGKFIKTTYDIKLNKESKNQVKKLFSLIEDFTKELIDECKY